MSINQSEKKFVLVLVLTMFVKNTNTLCLILTKVAEVHTEVELALPIDFCHITHHWPHHFGQKYIDNGTFPCLNMFPEERLHQTLRKLAGQSKRNVGATLAMNYTSFNRLQLDWAMDDKIINKTSEFNIPPLFEASQDIKPGTPVTSWKVKMDYQLPDDIFDQVVEKLRTIFQDQPISVDPSTVQRQVKQYKHVYLDQVRFSAEPYKTMHKDDSFFCSLYNFEHEDGREEKKIAYGRIKEIFLHIHNKQARFFILAKWFEEVTDIPEIEPQNPVSGLTRVLPSKTWPDSIEDLSNFYPVPCMFYRAYPFEHIRKDIKTKNRRHRQAIHHLREVVQQKNVNLGSFD